MILKKPKYICKAAEYSLLFQPSGEILACHYNRGYILGIYPKNSIKEIWNSKKRKKLLNSINKGNFKLGCYFCKEKINKGNIWATGFNKYTYIDDCKKAQMPISMEFQLDNICNLECIMCSGEYSNGIRKNREKGSIYKSPYDDEFVHQLTDYIPHLKYCAFTGGEPFLFDIYYKIWDKIKILNPDLQLYISSNGTILNDRIKSYLNDLNFNFSISIDSVEKETYEKIRKNAKLEETLANIEWYQNYCKLKNTEINIKSLVTPQNILEIDSLLKYCHDKNLPINFKFAQLPWFARIDTMSKENLDKVIKKLKNINLNFFSDIQKNNIENLKLLIYELESFENEIQVSDDLTTKSLNNLKAEFIKYILDFKSILNDKTLKKDDFYIKQITKLYSYIKNESKLKIAIENFLKIPAETTFWELHRLDLEKLGQRFIQATLTDLDNLQND